MTDKDIITLWKKGLSKDKLAEIYKRQYNQQIRIIRSTVKHRHDGRFITNYEALGKVEKAILRHIKEQSQKYNLDAKI